MNKKITAQSKDFSQWYLDLIYASQLVDHAPTKGCMIIRPLGYALWEGIQKELDAQIKDLDVQNCYFPLLIPEEFLKKEADHIEGFAPELAIVTHAGGKKLEENYVIRPTSETMVYHMFSKWINSWRDLPLKVNQWANVVRWEMRTRPFLRTTEFLWQEGHTAHQSKEEALEMTLDALEMYKNLCHDVMAIPVITGRKSDAEKFPGAEMTYTFEAIMPDGKALQMGTSHLLNQSFPKSFDVSFQNKENKPETPWCTSWGTTTRLIGALVMTHSDDKGLILPPRMAPTQVVIIPVGPESKRAEVLIYAETLKAELFNKNIRVSIDNRPLSPGAKFYDAELKGTPFRIEIGPQEVANEILVLKSRIQDEKQKINRDSIGSFLQDKLISFQNELFDRASNKQKSLIKKVSSWNEFKNSLEKGFAITSGWCLSPECEQELKKLKAFTRCLLESNENKICFFCKNSSKKDVLIAKSY
ncbi:proline--tRNA ligase [Candidatus Babeliales bacterium]|nr:proline--tRNA ligase [Candidatus Babeliales bacterium]